MAAGLGSLCGFGNLKAFFIPPTRLERHCSIIVVLHSPRSVLPLALFNPDLWSLVRSACHSSLSGVMLQTGEACRREVHDGVTLMIQQIQEHGPKPKA
jgi:hypothetical protein